MIAGQGRNCPVAKQAACALLLLVAACSSDPQLNPATAWREITGANLESRLPPPGLNDPSGNLGMVPARPDRPDPRSRATLDSALAADRAQSREPLGVREGPAVSFVAPAPGRPALPAAPPPPPSLAAAPPIPWTAPPILAPGVAAPSPGEVPALPTPDLLGPAPPR